MLIYDNYITKLFVDLGPPYITLSTLWEALESQLGVRLSFFLDILLFRLGQGVFRKGEIINRCDIY